MKEKKILSRCDKLSTMLVGFYVRNLVEEVRVASRNSIRKKKIILSNSLNQSRDTLEKVGRNRT